MSFSAQLSEVRRAAEDLEWYPTTQAIIDALVSDINSREWRNCWTRKDRSFLDIGAGNGKVLESVRETFGKLFAIEKSQVLRDLLSPDVYLMGVDFWRTSLLDKAPSAVFSNPPYREFVPWAVKILRETTATAIVYLVIPERWKNSEDIQEQMAAAKWDAHTVGRHDFTSAEDRTARAKVELVRFTARRTDNWKEKSPDPFTRFFDQTFTYPEPAAETQEEREATADIVGRTNFVEALCHLHDLRMMELQRNFSAACTLSREFLEEFSISKESMVESLKQKLATCRKEYWKRLFDGMSEINQRLTDSSRQAMAARLNDQTGIEFNRENAYAVIFWVLRNANAYFDSQLVETFERMIDFANVENYRSNHRVFTEREFRYDYWNDRNSMSPVRLRVGHRLVLHRCGGLGRVHYSKHGLCERGASFLSDLLTVARNLGFDVVTESPQPLAWDDSSARVFAFRLSGKLESLIRVRAFGNSNMHVQFHPSFIHALNTQHGKLKGWLRSKAEAATELDIDTSEAARWFSFSQHIDHTALRIGGPPPVRTRRRKMHTVQTTIPTV